METTTAAPCEGCDVAMMRHRQTGAAVVCVCGRVWAPAEFRWPVSASVPVRQTRGRPDPSLRAQPHAAAGAEAEVPFPTTALERAGARARALVPDDPELARVRRVLADLRPDCGDPLEPPPPEATEPPPVVVRDPSASWGGVPRGVGFGAGCALGVEVLSARCVADVVSELAFLAPDARAVLRWLRAHGTLRDGLRGLYVDVGLAFASAEQSAAWVDLGARREGSPMHGRRLVLAAATAWGR